MSTYWIPENAKYEIVYVLENITSGIQSTHIIDVAFIGGKAFLLPGLDSQMLGTSAHEIKEGEELISVLPNGMRVVSVDTSQLPEDIATVSYKDGTTDDPAVGVLSKKELSKGLGIDSTTASTQSAPS